MSAVFMVMGSSLFWAAIAQWYIRRKRQKSNSRELSKSNWSWMSVGMWLASGLSVLLIISSMVILGVTPEQLERSESWILVSGGLFAYAFGTAFARRLDKRAENQIASQNQPA